MIPLHLPSPIALFPFLHDLVCILLIYTLSFSRFFISAVSYTWELQRTPLNSPPLMDIPRPFIPCISLHPSSLFPLSQFHLSFPIPSHQHRFLIHTVSCLPQLYSSISLFSRHIPLPFHLISAQSCIPAFLLAVHVLEHIIHPVYSFHPVLMCTLVPTGLEATIVITLFFLNIQVVSVV